MPVPVTDVVRPGQSAANRLVPASVVPVNLPPSETSVASAHAAATLSTHAALRRAVALLAVLQAVLVLVLAAVADLTLRDAERGVLVAGALALRVVVAAAKAHRPPVLGHVDARMPRPPAVGRLFTGLEAEREAALRQTLGPLSAGQELRVAERCAVAARPAEVLLGQAEPAAAVLVDRAGLAVRFPLRNDALAPPPSPSSPPWPPWPPAPDAASTGSISSSSPHAASARTSL